MKRFFLSFSVFVALLFSSQLANSQKIADLKFYDVKQLIKENKAVIIGQAESSVESFYYRLPHRLKDVVRKELWELGVDGAGIAIRFSTDSKNIGAKWTLSYNFGMAHMAATGVKGLDLYYLHQQQNSLAPAKKGRKSREANTTKEKFRDALSSLGEDIRSIKNKVLSALDNQEWRYAGTAFPNGKESASFFVKKLDGMKKEYILYLPLYDGVEELSIGIDSSAVIYSPNEILTPNTYTKQTTSATLPIVFYGTSVTQGGCASRPGMAYPSIIERVIGIETINLGFSGNGRMDKNMADFISGIKASAYVIDCLANCTYETTRDSSTYFIHKIASSNPDKLVYMVNNYHYPQQSILPENNADMESENSLWYNIYKELKEQGALINGKRSAPLKNLRFIDVSSKSIIGYEDSVDGTHLTDMGFTHLATAILRQMEF